MKEITIDEVNDLYVTKISSGDKLYYKLYNDKELKHTHIIHIDDEDCTPITVYTMVSKYVKVLEQEVKDETDSIMKELEVDDPMTRQWAEAADRDYHARNRERVNSLINVEDFDEVMRNVWYWSESTDPSNLI